MTLVVLAIYLIPTTGNAIINQCNDLGFAACGDCRSIATGVATVAYEHTIALDQPSISAQGHPPTGSRQLRVILKGEDGEFEIRSIGIQHGRSA